MIKEFALEPKDQIDLQQLMAEAYATECKSGFRDKPKDLAVDIALMHSELSEALEDYRRAGDYNFALREIGYQHTESGKKPVGVASEFADVIILIAATCRHHGIPLVQAV